VAGTPHRTPTLSVAQRRREARRKEYRSRRIAAAVVLLALIVGAYFGLNWLAGRFFSDAGEEAKTTKLSFTAERFLDAGDLDGDTKPERVAVGAAENNERKVALVTGPIDAPNQVGEPVTVLNFNMAVTDLPWARRVLVLYRTQPVRGEPAKANIPGGQVTASAGGEPNYQAWKLDMAKGLVPADYYALVAPDPANLPAPTSIVVDRFLNVLWYYEEGKLLQTSRVTTGLHIDAPPITADNQAKNQMTPLGQFTIANKKVNPAYFKDNIPGGDPRNPLGTRWLGFSVYSGDNAEVWGIHGTNDNSKIGWWASNGCIRLTNDEVQKLYERVKAGTILQILTSKS